MAATSDVPDVYRCEGCGALLKAVPTWADGWCLCPECDRPGRPPVLPISRPYAAGRAVPSGDGRDRPSLGALTLAGLLTLATAVGVAGALDLGKGEAVLLGAVLVASALLLARPPLVRRGRGRGAAGRAQDQDSAA